MTINHTVLNKANLTDYAAYFDVQFIAYYNKKGE